MMMAVFLTLFAFNHFILTGISYKIDGYNFTRPDNHRTLPDHLKEISGLVSVDGSYLACIQDEDGIIFMYDLKKNTIDKRIAFSDDGDYEDIAIAGNLIFILRSDGTLYKISSLKSESVKSESVKTDIPSEDNEGLCYDPELKKLLIACKGNIKSDKLRNRRAIYSYDFRTESLSHDPIIIIDPEMIGSLIENSPGKILKTDDDIDFKISAIGIHPITKKIFVIAASDYLLCVFNHNGDPENIEILDRDLFNKAEGIAFLPNGDLFISNEGADGKASILYFKYKIYL